MDTQFYLYPCSHHPEEGHMIGENMSVITV